jgi:hypothetical protein
VKELLRELDESGQQTQLQMDVILILVDRNTVKYQISFLRHSPNVEGATPIE